MRRIDRMMEIAGKWGLNRARIMVIALSFVVVLVVGLVFVTGLR